MAQLNVYVPEELEEKIKAQAKREKKSVSAFVLDAVKTHIQPTTWSPTFLKLLDTPPEHEFQIPEDDLPLRTVDSIEEEENKE